MTDDDIAVRAFEEVDTAAVLDLSLRAWERTYEAWRVILGERVFPAVYPDWRASQREAVQHSIHTYSTLVGLWGGMVAGFVTMVQHSHDVGEIDMLAVDPAFQQRGIGAALLTTAIGSLRESGVQRVEIGTGGDAGHAAARRLYERAGFVGLPLVRYYQQF